MDDHRNLSRLRFGRDRSGCRVASASGSVDAGDAATVLAKTIWGEARGEPTAGREAVAAVVMNRLRAGRFGSTVPAVCRQPMQFSCWNAGDPNHALLDRLAPGTAGYDECLLIAKKAIDGQLPDPTNGACFYHTAGSSASWSLGKTPCCTIGHHLFYNDIA